MTRTPRPTSVNYVTRLALAEAGVLRTWVALAVQRVAEKAVGDAHFTANVVIRAAAATMHDRALGGGGGADGYQADAAADDGRHSGLAKLAHFSSLGRV